MAVENITMPQLGESVTEGTINSWLVKVGDHVEKYEPIADIMTDKVTAEVPSSFSGTISELLAEEGDTIAVGDVMCKIEVEQMEQVEATDDEINEEPPLLTTNRNDDDTSMKKRYSPAVLRLAQEHAIDLTIISGSGRGGRITRKDVERFIERGHTGEVNQEAVTEQTPSPVYERMAHDIEIPVKGVRKVIADHIVKSKTEIPHAWMTVEVDVTNLVNYRNKIKQSFKKNEGFNISYFSFFINAVTQALKEYPQLNSTWAGDKIIQRKDINISIAVAKEEELFVPVIKQADEKNIKAIARSVNDLATRARTGQLTNEDMQDGTFTVNNTGTFGSISSMGIINHPQGAILQVESIVKRPVVINNMIAIRDMVNLSLSLDHRILDGLVCGRFMARVKEILEQTSEETANVY
ncbi:MAG TPA: dihydrolipoamide acetyltransferase family protein [Bacillota bacterium]|nr:dihydrolipoamide acetyltransferase family protein [Bacillota bacterium]